MHTLEDVLSILNKKQRFVFDNYFGFNGKKKLRQIDIDYLLVEKGFVKQYVKGHAYKQLAWGAISIQKFIKEKKISLKKITNDEYFIDFIERDRSNFDPPNRRTFLFDLKRLKKFIEEGKPHNEIKMELDLNSDKFHRLMQACDNVQFKSELSEQQFLKKWKKS